MNNAQQKMPSLNGWEQLIHEPEEKEAYLIPEMGKDQRQQIVALVKKCLLEGKKISKLYEELKEKGLLEYKNRDERMSLGGLYRISTRLKTRLGLREKRLKQKTDFMDMYAQGFKKKRICEVLGLTKNQYDFLYDEYRRFYK